MLDKYDLVKLSDGKEYIVLDIVNYNNNLYAYLSAKDGESSFYIFKLTMQDTFITKLDEEEMVNVLRLINKSNVGKLGE